MSRQGQLVIPPIALDHRAATPLYRQLAGQLAAAIRRDALVGARLPSTRVLAALLGVSRNTVLAAYDELVAAGLLEGRHGSGTRVPRAGLAPAARFSPTVLLREAQYPTRTLGILDPDGSSVHLTY